MNHYDLSGKVAMITGAGTGIGRATALELAKSGADVILCARTLEKLKSTADAIETLGVKALPIKTDVTNIDDINTAVKKGVETFGHIDILVNSAGHWAPMKLVDMEPEFWDNMQNTHLRGAVFASKAVARQMIDKNIHGTIILMSSQAAKVGEYGNSAYGSAKNAMHTLCQCMSLELGEYGINTVTICPGFTYSEMLRDVFRERSTIEGKSLKDYENALSNTIPMKRFCECSEIGSLIAFLSSEEASYISGVTITVAGGNINI